MHIKIVGVFFLTLFSLSAIASPEKTSKETLPFVNYKTKVTYTGLPPSVVMQGIPSNQTVVKDLGSDKTLTSGSVSHSSLYNSQTVTVEQDATISDIPLKDVQKLIGQVRLAVCDTVNDGDVKVWLSLDASGKLLGFGASAQSGLEVTFHCKGK